MEKEKLQLVVLEKNSKGVDVDLSFYENFGEVTYYGNTVEPEVAERVKDADIVIANKAPMNESTLRDAKNVKLICEFATGFDNVDLAYCRENGIKVANVVDYSTSAVAQHTLAMALYLMEHLPFYDNYVKSGTYAAQDRFSNFDMPFRNIEGKTWGIIGLGNIGKRVASIAKAMGCHVIYYSVTGTNKNTDYESVSLEKILKQADILSIHCPLSDITHNLIAKQQLEQMKKTAILINVARGPVVNNKDLYEALENETIQAAGLDVLEKEPLSLDNPLSKIKDSNRLLITPHMGWAITEARENLAKEVYLNIEAFLYGNDRNIVS